MDLRDRSGLVQVTADPSVGEAYGVADKARSEYVLQVIGNSPAEARRDRESEPGERRD